MRTAAQRKRHNARRKNAHKIKAARLAALRANEKEGEVIRVKVTVEDLRGELVNQTNFITDQLARFGKYEVSQGEVIVTIEFDPPLTLIPKEAPHGD